MPQCTLHCSKAPLGIGGLQTKHFSFAFSTGNRSAHSNTAYGTHVADADHVLGNAELLPAKTIMGPLALKFEGLRHLSCSIK